MSIQHPHQSTKNKENWKCAETEKYFGYCNTLHFMFSIALQRQVETERERYTKCIAEEKKKNKKQKIGSESKILHAPLQKKNHHIISFLSAYRVLFYFDKWSIDLCVRLISIFELLFKWLFIDTLCLSKYFDSLFHRFQFCVSEVTPKHYYYYYYHHYYKWKKNSFFFSSFRSRVLQTHVLDIFSFVFERAIVNTYEHTHIQLTYIDIHRERSNIYIYIACSS